MPEKTVSFLGIVVPDESSTFLVLVAVHVAIALAAVVAGLVAMGARKGVGLHSRFGALYYWLSSGVFVTATALSAMRWAHDRHLFVLGALAFASATFGRLSLRAARRSRLSVHLSAMGVSYILLLTAFYVDNGKNLPLWRELPAILYWTLPAMIGIPVIARALLRHPLIRGSRD
jgi:uncharacterized membrane protein